MPIAPVGSTNLSGIQVPNVLVQIIPPSPLLNGVPTNVIGVVGIGSWGPVNAPVAIGSLQDQVANFGTPLNATYDMGTQVYNAVQQGASSFLCVRVTDGTDVQAISDVLDSVGNTALVVNALYTGVVGNNLNVNISYGSNYTSSTPTYKFTSWLSGGVPEVFDNIGGSGATFWTNLINAINMGQGANRGPSQLVRAGLSGTISAATVVTAGSYVTLPSLTATIGTLATLTPTMKAVSAAIASGGTDYAVNDTITLAGGTFGTAAVLTVTAVNSGVITAVSLTTAGSYTVLPSNPVAQGSTSGSGTTATFTMAWGLLSVAVTGGSQAGYTAQSVVVITGGGGSGGSVSLTISATASTNAPALPSNAYTFSGGTNGNSSVTDATLIGNDTTSPRQGMYALRNTQASIGVLADQTVVTNWNTQATFGLQEGMYMIVAFPNGYENNIGTPSTPGSMVGIKASNNIGSYALKIMAGDWCQINDPFNSVFRFTNPSGFVAGILATQLPSNSSLNKPINGIIATQKATDMRVYSNFDLQSLQSAGIDVITSPIPASNTSYGCRLGNNSSGVATTYGDNYTRMNNFLALTFETGLGQFIGQPQTVDLQSQARATLQGFLNNIQQLGMIGTLNGGVPYSVILDSTNNPPTSVALGYMIANVEVTLWSIVLVFVVNLQAGQSVVVSTLPPQLI